MFKGYLRFLPELEDEPEDDLVPEELDPLLELPDLIVLLEPLLELP